MDKARSMHGRGEMLRRFCWESQKEIGRKEDLDVGEMIILK
jgi:hypothetical protein